MRADVFPIPVRRAPALAAIACALALFFASAGCRQPAPAPLLLATFAADVTPPLGHVLFTGHAKPAEAIDDPLSARGLVLLPAAQPPIVFVAVDWAEIRNDAYALWREALAAAAATTPDRVLVSCIHQHDTPLADLEAQRLLDASGAEAARIIDPVFHDEAVRRVAAALSAGLRSPQPVTSIGIGEAEVKKVASNRRFLNADGTPNYGRSSGGANLAGRAAPEGVIDPMLKTLSFWHHDRAVAALSIYATHPMSLYGNGRVSADFPGDARARRQQATPVTFQIYASGASGNVTIGKYNDGKPESRAVFGARLHDAMRAADAATTRHPVERLAFRSVDLHLAPRESPGFTREDLERALADGSNPRKQSLAALGLSWRKRVSEGRPVDLPMIDFGHAQLLLLPAEIYVEFQLYAQELRPESFVMVAGYGECAPGYIPIERAWEENDGNLATWCWVAPGAEEKIRAALRQLLAD